MTGLATSDQEAFRVDVRAFTARLEPEPIHASLDDRFRFLVGFQHRLHEAGLAVVAWPERYGGRGLGAAEAAIVAEELGAARAPEVINFVGTDVVAPALMHFVEAERLARWLPAMAAADEIWCQLFSEPDAGSDLASLRTRAIEDGDGWVVTGTKVWSTWAQFAHWGILLARTGTVGSRHRGITAFVVDMRRPGIEVRPLRTMTGDSEFAEVHFDGARVPSDGLVGTVDEGWAVTLDVLTQERGPYAVRRASVLRGALQEVLRQARGRALDTTSRHEVVGAHIAMSLLDRRIRTVVDLLAGGEVPGVEATVTKALLTRAEQAVFAAAHRLLGLEGVAWNDADAPAARTTSEYLYSRAASIYGGTAQIQRNIIGERLLGLPREPV